ncbi:MAG: peptidoglycan DD-metalloendopeptidase family protein [Chloroflexi bacterium]|nr:peptidoglycan DD-metalloendopeptidase family protein [Chloroflexota bacterium]
MFKSRKFHRWLSLALLVWVMAYVGYALSGCSSSDKGTKAPPVEATQNSLATAIALQAQATSQPTATTVVIGGNKPSATPTASMTATASPTFEFTPAPSVTATFPATRDPNEAASSSGVATAIAMAQTITGDHFWISRPFFTENGVVDYAERLYDYGSTSGGRLRPHYGIDFVNPFGTMVLAANDGVVFFAGSDIDQKRFGPTSNFYGNTIVIQHTHLDEKGQPFFYYTLYGHLSSINVVTGQSIRRFDPIGQVGQSGVAIGPHLHLEIRIGDPYSYGSTYNPELWLEPFPGYGVLAGRVALEDGTPLYEVEIKAESVTNGAIYRAYTYADSDPALNGDPYLRENWVMGDLEAGVYNVTVGYLGRIVYQAQVAVIAGTTGFLPVFVN